RRVLSPTHARVAESVVVLLVAAHEVALPAVKLEMKPAEESAVECMRASASSLPIIPTALAPQQVTYIEFAVQVCATPAAMMFTRSICAISRGTNESGPGAPSS